MEASGKFLDVQNLCRICLEVLQTDIKAYNLFEIPELAMKLFVCASVQVDEHDGYPRCICDACFTKLNELHKFQILCQESLQRLDVLVKSKHVLKNSSSSDNLVNTLEKSNVFVELQDFEDGRQPTLSDNSLADFDPLLSPKMDFIEDEECDFNMLETVNVDRVKNLDTTESDEHDNDDDDKPLAKYIPKNQLSKKHKNYENSSLVVCNMWKEELSNKCCMKDCQRAFTTPNGLRLHVEQCHMDIVDWFSCPEIGCDKKFSQNRQLSLHLTKIHKISKKLRKKSYSCSACDKVFCSTFSLKKHMYKHDGILPYSCNICEKRFVTNSALKDHLMRHAGIKNYTCPHCGVGKTTRQEWNAHLVLHNNEKNYKCDLCNYATHSKQNLRMHVKLVHDKIRDYSCQYCGKTFGKSNACKMHEMAHTGEKRCECKICGKRFLYAKSLTRHLKTHASRVFCAIKVYRKRRKELDCNKDDEVVLENNDDNSDTLPLLSEVEDHTEETHQRVTEKILKVCAESAASIPKNPRLVERVNIEKLAGTILNPLTQVDVPSLSPKIDFMMKEGSHICPDCGQGFNGSSNMRRHHRIVHQGVKNFACRFCYQRFAKSQTLKHHEMTHTGEKPNECLECGKRFIQRAALNRHMKVHSKSSESPAISTNPLQ